MSDIFQIAKIVFGLGRALLYGWILPSAINVFVFFLFVLPSLLGTKLVSDLIRAGAVIQLLVTLGASALIGLLLNALQVPLYRVLEGYVLLPSWIATKRRDHHVRAKHLLQDRLEAIRLRTLSEASRLEAPEDKRRLAELDADPKVSKFTQRDQAQTLVQRAILRERLRRYPVDDAQVAPTRLGNAIRRLEEYAWQRYRLDSHALWYELAAVAPKESREQVDLARASADFYVCLLSGNLLVAASALISLSAHDAHYSTLLTTAAVIIVVSPLWYGRAVLATDDWELAVRAMVNVARRALAEALGLQIPKELSREREMWLLYGRFVRRPYDSNSPSKLDEFRAASGNG
jgi:hypothetical protein